MDNSKTQGTVSRVFAALIADYCHRPRAVLSCLSIFGSSRTRLGKVKTPSALLISGRGDSGHWSLIQGKSSGWKMMMFGFLSLLIIRACVDTVNTINTTCEQSVLLSPEGIRGAIALAVHINCEIALRRRQENGKKSRVCVTRLDALLVKGGR